MTGIDGNGVELFVSVCGNGSGIYQHTVAVGVSGGIDDSPLKLFDKVTFIFAVATVVCKQAADAAIFINCSKRIQRAAVRKHKFTEMK